jgi:hypothetical protein
VPDWDNTDSRGRDEDAAWRDLVARFDAPSITEQPVPWPAREDVPPSPAQKPQGPQQPLGAEGNRGTDGTRGTLGTEGVQDVPEGEENRGVPGAEGNRGVPRAEEAFGVGEAEGALGAKGADGDEGTREGTREAQGIRGFDDEGIRSALNPDGLNGAREPDVIQAARRRRRPPAAHSVRPRQAPADPAPADDEHFVPPAPPPLPKLDSITKAAWAALFGGPGYLVVATVAGWSVSGITAFCAVAAFVTGFALLVLRMNEPGSGGPDDGDDGAVV